MTTKQQATIDTVRLMREAIDAGLSLFEVHTQYVLGRRDPLTKAWDCALVAANATEHPLGFKHDEAHAFLNCVIRRLGGDYRRALLEAP